jgi:SAM-dependent methyltransferase
MGDLLKIDYSNCNNFRLTGADIDPQAIEDAGHLAEEYNLSDSIELYQSDAWDIPFQNRFTLLTSNGLNIYEPDDENVTRLYGKFFDALKPGGILVSSFITPQSEWNFQYIDENCATLRKIIFFDVLDVKWGCFRSSGQTEDQLRSAGFRDIKFIYDDDRVFPTVTAKK